MADGDDLDDRDGDSAGNASGDAGDAAGNSGNDHGDDGADAGAAVRARRRSRVPARYEIQREYARDTVEFNRIVNITDAVVAIAITILVLQLAVPAAVGDNAKTDIGALMRDLQAPMLAFALSFVIIAFSWFGHQRFVERLLAFDNAMLMWNFCYLFLLVLVPFASDLVGNYGDNPAAEAMYAGVMAVLFAIDFPGRMLASHRGLLADHYTHRQWWAHGVLALSASAVFLVSIPILLLSDGAVGGWMWIFIWPVSTISGRWVKRVDRNRAEVDATSESASEVDPGTSS